MRNPHRSTFEPLPPEVECTAKIVLDAAFKIHTALGPGLLESVYGTCLEHEIRKRGVQVDKQVIFPITYDGLLLESGLRLDILVDKCLIVEIKAVEKLLPVHEAQLLTYLRLTGLRLGLLINFYVPRLKDGIKRIIV